jgi:hypothetical protein
MSKAIAISICALCVVGCTERDSNYETIKYLTGTERVNAFRKLPLSERFRIYKKLYKHSGDPPDAGLFTEFEDNPNGAIEYIINDLKSSKFTDFVRYGPIIYDVGTQTNVGICKSEYIVPLKKIIEGYHLSDVQLKAVGTFRFDRCTLP